MRKRLNSDLLKKCMMALLAVLILSWVLYGAFAFGLIKGLYEGQFPALADRVMSGQASTPLENYVTEADGFMLGATFWALITPVVLLVILKNPWMLLYATVSFVVLWGVVICCVQLEPALADALGLGGVEYYGDQKYFVPDAELVYIRKNHSFT